MVIQAAVRAIDPQCVDGHAGRLNVRLALRQHQLRAAGQKHRRADQGQGEPPAVGTTIRARYTSRLLVGNSKFDSSYDRGEPAEFGLNQVIPGWTEGLGLMPVGAKYRLWIPAQLGYGPAGAPPRIPPNATLVFDVELLGVE